MEDSLTSAQSAQALVQALPYIQRYNGKTIVVKYGGNAMINETLKKQVMDDIVLLQLIGVRVVLVHGGGPAVNEVMERMALPVHFVDGQRVTDDATMEVVQMVLAGKVNKTLVNLLQVNGGMAMGVSGIDGHIIEAEVRNEKLGNVGRITRINAKPLSDILDAGYIPVVSTIGADASGNVYNINGDIAAAAIAAALKAERLIMMTDINGILEDKDNPESLIRDISISEAAKLQDKGIISGGMIPKVECCISAITQGVGSVVIIDGRIPHSLLVELLTDEGAGTMVTQ